MAGAAVCGGAVCAAPFGARDLSMCSCLLCEMWIADMQFGVSQNARTCVTVCDFD